MEKERRTKALLLSTLVVVVATVSIAFAAMSRTLSINGIGKMDTASWSVYFDNLSDAIADGAKEEGKPNINAIDKGIIENINVKLFNPGDEISYTVDIVNDGTIDAEITMIKDIELTEVQKKIFGFKVTYTATGEILKDGDVLPAGDTKNITITIRFRDDITEFDLPTESQIINLSYQITYTQYDGGNIPIIPDGGDVIVRNKSVLNYLWRGDLFEDDTYGGYTNGNMESITFLDNVNVPEEAKSTITDVSYEKNNSILAWYTDVDSNGLYETYVGSNDEIELYVNDEDYAAEMVYDYNPYSYYFSDFNSKLKTINFNGNVNVSRVINMKEMFFGCNALLNLDLSLWDTSNVTDMESMFGGNDSYSMNLKSINLSSFDTSKVTNMSGMFDECSSLTNLNVSNFDTQNVTNMGHMFSGCSSLTNLDVSHFITSNVTDMSAMFNGCSSLTSLNVSNFDTQNVTLMGSSTGYDGMFGGCSSLTNLDLSNFNTSKVTNMGGMFLGLKLKTIDLSNFDTSNVNGMVMMFARSSFETLDLSKFNTDKVTTMSNMFYNCASLTSIKMNSASFGTLSSGGKINIFQEVPNNFTIYVKDETAKNFILGIRSDANVIIEPLNS